MRFGQGPLRLPLLVEAIETQFVPLCIFNNTKAQEGLLRRYKEPAWNNPVFRFFSADGKELIQRKDGVWNALGVVSRTRSALEAAGTEPPAWLTLLEQDLVGEQLERATLAMHCFWEGERRLGLLAGVISTEAAWLGGKEVVDVVFDPEILAFKKLLETAKEVKCLHHVYARTDDQVKTAKAIVGDRVSRVDEASRRAEAKDRKFYLAKSKLRHLPLTPAQATKMNAALGQKKDAKTYLSPRQLELYGLVCVALTEEPELLAGLRRPDELAALADYENALRGRLAGE